MALPPRAPASSVEARDLIMVSVRGSSTSIGSGTSSTIYTSSRGSVLSSDSELGLASQLQRMRIDESIDEYDEEKEKRLERFRHLAKEFCHGDGDIAALEKWLSEMGVRWVLDLAADPSAGEQASLVRAQPQRNNLAERWIRALNELTGYAHSDPDDLDLVEGQGTDFTVRFVEAIVLKMLPFVDALLAATGLDDTADVTNGVQAPFEKLQELLGVRDALSSASGGLLQLQCYYVDWYCYSAEMEAHRLHNSLMSEKEHMLEEAIWNTMQEVRISILSDGDGSSEWGIQIQEGSSSNICKDTRSLMAYIKYLWDDYSRLDDIVHAAAKLGNYVPNRDIISSFLISVKEDPPFTSLTLEMVASLDAKLAKRSETFPDHSLRLIFVINNTHFMQQQLNQLPPTIGLVCRKAVRNFLTPKIEDYIQKYLQASWVPVMSSLYDHTTRWFRKNSTLPKFHSEFQKTYTAQKFWKVPDPELRTRLRKAIVEQVIPGLTGYLEANNITSPGVTPQEREEMLLELFEG